MFFIIMSLALIELFSTKIINSTAVRAVWFEVESPHLDHYTVYYYPISAQNGGGRKRQSTDQMTKFPAGVSFGVIGGLDKDKEYLFSIAAILLINGKIYEGERTEPAPPGEKPCNLLISS